MASSDVEKAFDRGQIMFLEQVMKKNELPSNCISWIKMYYYNLSAQVIASGIISPVIKMQYETHQECPLSPFNI